MGVRVVLDLRSAEPRALSGSLVTAKGWRGVHSGILWDLGEGLRTGLQNPPLLIEPPKHRDHLG